MRLAAALLALSLPPSAAAAEAPAARAIVLLSIDDLRADAAHGLGFHRMRKQSVDYASADTAATWTLPSHATMLTGLLPAVHGAGSGPGQDSPLPAGAPYAPELLRRAGWRTAGFVQAAYLDASFGFARGFETYRSDRHRLFESDSTPLGATLEDALAWVKRHRSERLFLFAHLYTVHLYTWLREDRAPSGPKACPLPVDFKDPASAEPTPDTVAGCARARIDYEDAVACADERVDGFIRALDALVPRESTLVILTSDHGESLCDGGDTGRRSHAGPPLPEQVRVPLIVRFPGGRGAGTRVTSAVSLADVAPTILAAAGVKAPVVLDGSPLEPAEGAPGRVVMAQGKDWSSARAGSLRLTRYDGGRTDAERDGFRAEPGPADPDAARLRAALDALPARAARRRSAFGLRPRAAPAALPSGVREALRAEGYLP